MLWVSLYFQFIPLISHPTFPMYWRNNINISTIWLNALKPGARCHTINNWLWWDLTPTSGSGIQCEGSRNLQWCSHIVADAAGENGPRIMDPPPEMISNSQAQEHADKNYTGPSVGRLVNPSLDPMPKDEEWNMVIRPLDNTTSHKKGKGVSNPTTNPCSVKGTHAPRGNSSDDDTVQRVRQSSCQTHQKTARNSEI